MQICSFFPRFQDRYSISVRNLHCILLLHMTHSSKVNCTLDKVNCTLCVRKHTILGPAWCDEVPLSPIFSMFMKRQAAERLAHDAGAVDRSHNLRVPTHLLHYSHVSYYFSDRPSARYWSNIAISLSLDAYRITF